MINSDWETIEPKAVDTLAGLTELAAQGATILTPNKRLANYFAAALDSQLARLTGCTAWAAAQVMPYDSWLDKRWQAALLIGDVPNKVLLDTLQDQWQWERAIESCDSTGLLSVASTASAAQRSYRLLRSWLIRLDDESQPMATLLNSVARGGDRRFDFLSDIDARHFSQWLQAYLARMDDSGQICFADASLLLLSSALLHAEPAAEDAEFRSLVMAGFQSPTPLQQSMLQACSRAGSQLFSFQWPGRPDEVRIERCDSPSLEIQSAAAWAKQLNENKPEAQIAVVVQDLAQCRMEVERCFLEYFEPEALQIGRHSSGQFFNISAGVSLSSTAPAIVVLQLVRLLLARLPMEACRELLLSPYLGFGGRDYQERCAMVNLLEQSGQPDFTIEQFSRLYQKDLLPQHSFGAEAQGFTARSSFEQQAVKSEPSLCSVLSQFALPANLRARNKTIARSEMAFVSNGLSPSRWLQEFQRLLCACNWPGSRVPGSDEYQKIHRVKEALQGFSTLDVVCTQMDKTQALVQLERLFSNTIYQRESRNCKVQILGGLEASGRRFDYLRLVGMADTKWPATTQPDPFIPYSLQLELSMPAASVEREFDYSRRLSQAYLQSAPSVVLSYPGSLDDNPCQLSPLMVDLLNEFEIDTQVSNVHDYAIGESQNISVEGPLAATTFEQCFEWIDDSEGSELPAGSLKGGLRALANQAICPFKGYATSRLGLQERPELLVGITAQERGLIVHDALEYLWRHLGGSAALEDTAENDIEKLIQDAIENALSHGFLGRLEKPQPILLEVEAQRLQLVLRAWLELERARPEFIVQALESRLEVEIAGLTISMRLDRLDRVGGSQLLLIDYKTGAIETAGLLADRLVAPQLPAYVLGAESLHIDGLAYASLKSGSQGFRGLSADELEIPGIKPVEGLALEAIEDWSQLQQRWKQSLESVATELRTGYAAVDPGKPADCRHCHLRAVCRVDENVAATLEKNNGGAL